MNGKTIIAPPLYQGRFRSLDDIDNLESRWRSLEGCSDCSFFVSWSWIGPWLRLVREHTALSVYECCLDGAIVAMAIVCKEAIKRRVFFRTNTITMNDSSHDHLNMFIEYNGLLARQGHESAVLHQFINDLNSSDSDWDELYFTNMPSDSLASLDTTALKLKKIPHSLQGVWAALLEPDSDRDSLISRLSTNRRWQLRRSLKEYQKSGALTIDAATSTEEALTYFSQMGILHTERWNRAGRTGTFAYPNWVKFHRELIREAFARNEIQLLRIRCGNKVIGYIYNFIWRDSVLMLQSGFVSESSNILRPGYVSHLLAMEFNAARGAKIYNFLAGESEYKRVLGTDSAPLTSIYLQRNRLKFALETALVRSYRALRRSRLLAIGRNKLSSSATWIASMGVHLALQDMFCVI